jgi:hypothetical protein
MNWHYLIELFREFWGTQYILWCLKKFRKIYRIIKNSLDHGCRGINKLSYVPSSIYSPRLCLNEFREQLALL